MKRETVKLRVTGKKPRETQSQEKASLSSANALWLFWGQTVVVPSGKQRKLRSRLCGGPGAEARWLRCPLARELGRGLRWRDG